MQTGVALGAFYFHPTNGEPSPTITVFSRQLTDRELSMSQLPEPFAEDLEQWVADARIPEVTPRYFIPENGKKYVLAHDEDYCWHPPGTLAPDPVACQQLNASAADQVAWVDFRDRSCGIGLACRIRVTRQRTRVLIGDPTAPHGRR